MIIGISGNNGAGKNTVGAMVSDYFNSRDIDMYQRAFADSLYEICDLIFKTPSKKECEKYPILKNMTNDRWCGKSVRDLLIATGAFCRSINPDYWVEQLKRRLRKGCHYVITDVRFFNEAQICDYLIHVERPGCIENVGDLWKQSDASLDTIKDQFFLIKNTGDLTRLKTFVDSVCSIIYETSEFQKGEDQ